MARTSYAVDPNRPGIIYFVHLPIEPPSFVKHSTSLKQPVYCTDLYKVGYTRNIAFRLAAFQLEYSLYTRVLRLALVSSPLFVESKVHHAIRDLRIGTTEFYIIPDTLLNPCLREFDEIVRSYRLDSG